MRRRTKPRRGQVLYLTLFFLTGSLALAALAIDLGYIMVARTQLQRTADAAALAGCWELVDQDALVAPTSSYTLAANARQRSRGYAAWNPVLANGPEVPDSDVEVGHLANPSNPGESIDFFNNKQNAVRVTIRRDDIANGDVKLLFGPFLGRNMISLEAQATAALRYNFGGFRLAAGEENLGILPFALDRQTWNNMRNYGIGTDDWTWNAEEQRVEWGPDGILEVNLYPQGTGSPGNRGTVDIGPSNNSTADIARQILHGLNAADLEAMGGKVELNEYGELELNGDTGISAGVKDELESIKGKPRVIPIFSSVVGPGNNAQYTIVEFAGVRIMEVKLTGKMSGKRVIIQPCNVVIRGGIPRETSETSHFIYSPVWLVR
mgnify:CR=1 FL=1